MGEGKRGKPSSELERLQIFEQLATEYFRMLELFEPDEGPAPPLSIEGERRRWLELFRAALLRKFVVRDEHVSLKLVLRALRRCNYSQDTRVAEGAEAVAGLFTAELVHDRQAAPPDPHREDAQDIFEDVLYGRLLHGDADRFHRSGWADDYSRLSAVASSRFEAEHALRKALEVVSYGLANGLLRSPDGPAAPADAGPAVAGTQVFPG